ncbi:hypothetical protein G7Y89_g6849 [Cudoniella acicularis]|uniref:Uncharacterized protein n=1 Tax=Cudoniella acicularis TaxID=354080 RepID=A0A8H4RJP8_9HELO|nr:hypothetical protein G7Y89_g6849 [Cudoniella acicularis]
MTDLEDSGRRLKRRADALPMMLPLFVNDVPQNRVLSGVDTDIPFTGAAIASSNHRKPDVPWILDLWPKLKAAVSQTSMKKDIPEIVLEDIIISCDNGRGTVDLTILYSFHLTLKTRLKLLTSFPAKENPQYTTITYSYPQYPPRYEQSPENKDINTNLGDFLLNKIITTSWNSSASHSPLPNEQVTKVVIYYQSADMQLVEYNGEFLKGCNVHFHDNRIDQSFDRDYVFWVATQTMVSFNNFALCTVHKVYPGFWGRIFSLY